MNAIPFEKNYTPKIGIAFWLTIVTLFIGVAAGVYFYMNMGIETKTIWVLLPLSAPIIFGMQTYFGTKYSIKDGYIHYSSGFFMKGSIPIHHIHSIKTNTHLWMGTKPSLASKGMIIKYSHYRQIFISPAEPEAFLADLKTINPAIEVV
jgi:hypothetical protein